jgi:hypothetical protein
LLCSSSTEVAALNLFTEEGIDNRFQEQEEASSFAENSSCKERAKEEAYLCAEKDATSVRDSTVLSPLK